MPINTPTGYLDITNATLRGSKIVTTGFVGIANANPTNHLSVGSNLHINDTHSNVLQISGNINAASVVLGGISIAPTFDLEIVTNTGNTTPYTVEFNNAATAFVTTANATIGDTLTASKLVGDGSGISAIQSSNVSDFGSNVSRITTLETDLGNNSARITNLSSNLSDNSARITNLSSNLSDNSARITNLSSNLSDNSSRITALESGDISISGDKTFTGDIIFESNVHMNSGNVFVANTVNLTVSDPIIELGSNNSGTNDLGIIMTRPNNNSNVAVVFDESVDILRMGYTLNGANDTVVDLDSNALAVSVQGALTAGSNLEVGTANLFVDTSTSRVGIGMSNPSYTLDVGGDINIASGSNLRIGGSIPVFSRWTASGSDIYRSSGNVGIGTVSPTSKLELAANGGSSIITLKRTNTSNGGAKGGIRFTENTNGYNVGTIACLGDGANTSGALCFYTKASSTHTGIYLPTTDERMRITSTGNVGIGTTSPSHPLTIQETTTNTNTVTYPLAIRAISSGTVANGFGAGIRFQCERRDTDDYQSLAGSVEVYGAGNLPGTSDLWNMRFGVRNNDTAVTPMTLRYDGNVGIGTTSPIAALDINRGAENNTTPALSIRGGLYDPSDLYVLNTYNVNTGVGFAAKVIGVNIKNKVESNNTVQLRNNVGGLTSAGAIYLGSDDINQGIFGVLGADGTAGTTLSEHLTVRAGGNVGIGLTGPESKLHIYGSDNPLMLQSQRSPYPKLSYDFSGTNAENFQFYDHHGSGRGFLYGRKYTTGTNPNANAGWHFYGNDNTLALRIDGSANVGIGTASPSYNLDVNGSFGAKNKGWYITGGGGNAVYNGANSNKNYFAYNVNNTVYGSSVTTYNGASSSAWRSNDGVFTYPEAGLYQVTIHMFINATSSGRYGVFRLNDSGGTSQFSQYMYFTPSGYAAQYQRSWTTFVRVESGWQSYMQPESGSITLYLANQHTCLLIDKIC
jgi:TolA-binding protein